MKKQKICIIGGGLTGLITAIALSRLNVKIDLISSSNKHNIKSNRTTAISEKNYNFLKKLKIMEFTKKEFWPCSKMKLYTERENEDFKEILDLGDNKKKKNILYMMKNSQLSKHIQSYIVKNPQISHKTNKTISKIISSGLLKSIKLKNGSDNKYNLIIVCTGNKSNIVKSFSHNEIYNSPYNEISITTILQHTALQNNITRQIFLKEGVVAFLPISNSRTSIVWSIKKNIFNKHKGKKNLYFKNKIKFFAKKFIKNAQIVSSIEYKDLNLLIRKKYYQDRILLFGDALHEVHNLAGQGFNMTIRDLINLEKILKSKISLGLDIGSSDILDEFSNLMKPRNFIYSIGIDLIKNFFSSKNNFLKNSRTQIITQINKNNFIKDQFINFADEGLKF